MASGGEGDLREELRELAAALRAHAEWQVQTGACGLPRAGRELHEQRVRAAAEAAEATPAPAEAPAPGPPSEPSAPRPTVPEPPTVAAATAAPAETLDQLREQVAACTRCRLSETRTQTVFARGDGSSRLCFVGEGPGADEDRQGSPFVGAAGQLLDRMIAAMGLSRDEVYVCNIVKCRPPGNRKPTPEEMHACRPFLERQLELLDPEVIVALGATAVQGLLQTTEGIKRLRGRWRLYSGTVAVMPTFHPAYLLRDASAKRQVWEDLQAVLRQMGRPIPTR